MKGLLSLFQGILEMEAGHMQMCSMFSAHAVAYAVFYFYAYPHCKNVGPETAAQKRRRRHVGHRNCGTKYRTSLQGYIEALFPQYILLYKSTKTMFQHLISFNTKLENPYLNNNN